MSLIQFENCFSEADKSPAWMTERAGLQLTAVIVYLFLQSLFSSLFLCVLLSMDCYMCVIMSFFPLANSILYS